jgi:hypothetical protein
MTSLLPSLQAADLRAALIEYLSTTFALTDEEVRIGLQGFLNYYMGPGKTRVVRRSWLAPVTSSAC